MSSAGDRIRYIRKELGLSQADFGRAIGQNRLAVARWESGDQEPRPIQLMALADLLALPADWLLNGGELPRITPSTLAALLANRDKPGLGLGVPSVRTRGDRNPVPNSQPSPLASPDAKAMFEVWLSGISRRVSTLMEGRSEWPAIPGISPEVMDAFSRQRAIPSMRMIAAFAEAFEVDEDWLLNGSPTKSKTQTKKAHISQDLS